MGLSRREERCFCPWRLHHQRYAQGTAAFYWLVKSIDGVHEKSSGKAIFCHYAEEEKEEDAVPRESSAGS